MSTTFISNHPQGRQAKFKANGRAVAFVSGVLISHDEALTDALKARDTFPIYGVHFHLRDLEEPLPESEDEPTVRQGARGTSSFKGARRV